MDQHQTAMRVRADEAMAAALAAADDALEPVSLIRDTLASIKLVCEDAALAPRDKLSLIDDALELLASVKKLVRAAQAPLPEALMEVLRRTNALLRRYTRLVR